MGTYVVALVNFFDNNLEQDIVQAKDEFDALRKALDGDVSWLFYEDFTTMEELKQRAFDADQMFSVIEI
jgi:hypothetical protein